jgi:hypothetical protein
MFWAIKQFQSTWKRKQIQSTWRNPEKNEAGELHEFMSSRPASAT